LFESLKIEDKIGTMVPTGTPACISEIDFQATVP